MKGPPRSIFIPMVLCIAGAVALTSGCGNENDPPVRISDECESDDECPNDQPICMHGECYPCVGSRDCEGDKICVKPGPPRHDSVDEDSVVYTYCAECRPTGDSSECPDGEVCKEAECNERTLECEPVGCVPEDTEEQSDASP